MLAKAEGLAGRFALIHHLLEAGDDLRPVGLRSLEAGIRFAEWVVAENLRVYRLVQEDRDAAQLRGLAELVRKLAKKLAGTVGARDLYRLRKTRYPTPDAAEIALETLVDAGVGEWVEPTPGVGHRGRQPARRFRPKPIDYDKYDKNPPEESDDGGPTVTLDDKNPDRPPMENIPSPSRTETYHPTEGILSYLSYLSYCRSECEAGNDNPTEGGLSCPCVVTSQAQLAEVCRRLQGWSQVGIDLETTGLDPRKDRIRLLSLCGNDHAFVIDCFAVDPTPLFDRLQNVVLVGHNLAFDLQFLGQLGFVPGKVWDSMLAAQVLEAGLPSKHTLKDLAQRYLGVQLDKTEQLADWSGSLTEAMLRYAALDAEVPLKLREVMLPQLQAAKLEQVLDLENRCLLAVVSMSANGVGFDPQAWARLAEEATTRRADLVAQLDALVPAGLFGATTPNWDSPGQVKQAFAGLGVTMDGTADDVLAGIDHPLATTLREYRTASKRASAYGIAWLRHVEGDRVYPQWRQCSTRSGRMSCSNPNLQQLPREPAYRQCFVAQPGHVLVKADYSQIELRLAAKIAEESRMIEAYRKGEDLHTLTAQTILGKAEVSKADRQLAKAINFGLLYGMGAKTFAQYAKLNYGVTLTEDEAKRYREKFFATYPGLRRWHRQQAGATDGKPIITRTLLGRQRLNVAKYTEKLNTPVQGSGADGLKAALALLWERRQECPSARLVLAVHDEIVVEVPLDDAERAKDWLVRCMQDGMQPLLDPVPCQVEATIAPSWGG